MSVCLSAGLPTPISLQARVSAYVSSVLLKQTLLAQGAKAGTAF